jgi:hypothetical protein
MYNSGLVGHSVAVFLSLWICSETIFAAEPMDELPPEVVEAQKSIEATRALLQQISYQATYEVKTHNQLQRAENAPALKNVPLREPAVSRGLVIVARRDDRQLVHVAPEVVAPAHANYCFAARSTYQQDRDIISVYSSGDETLRIDNVDGIQAIRPEPRNLIIMESVFRYDLTPDWERIYAMLWPADEQAAKEKGVRTRRVRKLPNENIEVAETLTVPFLITSAGPISVGRTIEYSAAVDSLPVRVTKITQGSKAWEFELKWIKLAGSGLWLPVKVVSSRYLPADSKPGAPDVLMEVQSFDLEASTVVTGEAVEGARTAYTFPATARVFDTRGKRLPKPGGTTQPAGTSKTGGRNDPATKEATTQGAPGAGQTEYRGLFETGVAIAACVFGFGLLQLARTRRGNEKEQRL